MHHFIFPSQDTYITNRPGLDALNFGVDEILQVGTQNNLVGVISPTRDYTYVDAFFAHVGVEDFNGQFTGSVLGPTGSASAFLNGSGSITSSSYFSGSYSGGVINGFFSSSFEVDNFTGSIADGEYICLFGTASGTDTRMENTRIYVNQAYIDRALLQFDLTAISASIADGTIVSASFHLKVKICNEYQLPIEYTLYIAPVSESWVMGDGYMSDGGSDTGASWDYRDYNGGTPWATTGSSFVPLYCTQSFRYKSADLDVDVTPIVTQWLNGSIPNNGFVIQTSDEFAPTGSGFTLKYFSEDTNTIYSPVLDVGWNNDWEFTTGSVSTGSVQYGYSSGSSTTVQLGSTLTGAGGIHGNFTSFALITIVSGSASGSLVDFTGFLSGSGFTGNINGSPVVGSVVGMLDTSSIIVSLPTEIHYLTATSPMEAPYYTPGVTAMFPPSSTPYTYLNLDYVWGGDEVGWSTLIPIPPASTISCSCGVSHSVQSMVGQFTDGPLSSSTFTAYYENYKIIFGTITGSWTDAALIGASVIIPLPQVTYPYVTAFVQSPYISGDVLGLYQTSGSFSASLNGQFVSGPLMGAFVDFQLSGSASTASYAYTSSVSFTSSLLYPLDVERPFSINLSNLQPTYKAGDIIKLGVFGRKKYPQKFFDTTNQQQQYLVPEFLPPTSYYALKDNQTDEIVLNFDSYTQISCGYPEGNYFLIDTTGLPQERFYRVLIRVEDGTLVDTIDTGKIFKITR